MDYDKNAKKAGDLLKHIAEIASAVGFERALGPVCGALREAWCEGRKCGFAETGRAVQPLITEPELEALEACMERFGASGDLHDPEHMATWKLAEDGFKKLSHHLMDMEALG